MHQLSQSKKQIQSKQPNSIKDKLDEYLPHQVNRKQMQKSKSETKRTYVKTNLASGYNWIYSENARYLQFLMINRSLFDLSIIQRKKIKVNVLMSRKIRTRRPSQCHSHHQKMLNKFKSVDNIIKQLKQVYKIEQIPIRTDKKQEVKVEENHPLKQLLEVSKKIYENGNEVDGKVQPLKEEENVDYLYYQ